MIEKSTQKVTKTVEVEEEAFVLTMSREEAEVVFSLLSKCNSVNQSHASNLWHQFKNVDVDVAWDTWREWDDQPTGTIRLVPYDD